MVLFQHVQLVRALPVLPGLLGAVCGHAAAVFDPAEVPRADLG